MSGECKVIVIPLELYITRGESVEGLTFIPASQLHRAGLQNQSVLKKGTKSSFQHELTCTNATSISPERTELKTGVKRKNKALTKEVLQGELQVCSGTRKVLARRESHLPQQTGVYQKLADISNLKLNDCVKNLPETKKNRTITSATYKHGENNAVTKDESNCAKQHKTGISGQEGYKNKLPEPSKIKHSTASRRKIHSEHDTNFLENDNPSKVGTQRKDEQNCDDTEPVIPARSKQIEALVSTAFPEDVPLRSKRVRKQNYQLEDSDTFVLEPVKKARTCRKVFPHKPKEQGAGITKDRYVNKDDEERTWGETEKIPELLAKQSARGALETKGTEIKEDIKSNSDEHRDGQVLRENTQSKNEHAEVRKVNRRRGRPKRNEKLTEAITNVSVNMQLRRSTRQCKVNYRYSEDSYVVDECSSFPNKNKKQEKMKGKNNLVANGKAAKSNVRNISPKKNSEKSIREKNIELDENLNNMKVHVCSEKTSLLKYGNPRYEKDKRNDVGSRGKEKDTSKNGGEEKRCKESERESTVTTKNTNKKAVKKSEQKIKKSKKPKNPQSEGPLSSEDCKITAKKGTLKYLHQREKYITALAREAEGEDDDFSENPFFAKKKFKFTNLLPPSHEDTLVIKTPKRGISEDREKAVVTPRTNMLGQLQPVTPTTQPYSPCPSLDSNTKKDALKQVYQWMKNKGRQPRRSRKVLHDISQQNIQFTPLELPAVQENQSGNESDTMDEYFGDGDSL